MPSAQNHLIERLPQRDRTRLLSLAEDVPLVLGQVLCESGQPARHVWFPVDGFVSLVAPIDGKPALEVGMVGREGMLGAQLILGVASVRLQALVQGNGSAWRIGRAAFRAELARSAPLRRLLDLYLYVLMAQLAGSAACLRFHEISPRLARWLLMSQDRAHAERFHVTHEFLAYMLGVRRGRLHAAQRADRVPPRRGACPRPCRAGGRRL
jgi:CRP-like cAMP-binding protein